MVQPGEPVARLLENLPQRPPTPPRESDNDRVRQGISVLRRVFSKDLRTSTPSISPSSSSESVNSSTDKSQKKVTWIEIGESPTVSSKGSIQPKQPLRLLPPPAERKPIKSILKPYSGVIAVDRSAGTTFGAPHTYPNFAAMLESIVKQLAGDDRGSRFDAYMTLSGVLKASENIPDPKALKEKMSLLTQFIQRDMSAKCASGALDTVLINNSLILLSILVWKPTCFECLGTEFCSYVMDRAINVFEDPQVSKDIVKHFLFIIGLQNFSAKVITSARVGRIIEALNSIEDRVRGRSVALGRLTIYRRLLDQARVPMLINISWVGNLCTDMTSSLKDIRAAAIMFGFEAALQLGAEKQASRAVMELFEREQGEAIYADNYAKRLSSMIRNKQEGASVPQIWSIILLFLRHHPQQLEYWEFITRWLKIIQECFNKSDREVRLQANLAWNRLVFAIYPDDKTTPTMIKMLGQALSGQLKRKLVGRNAKEERQVAIGSVCNLLYYALRPNATAAQLDLYWDEYVVLLVGRMLVSTDQCCFPMEEDDLAQACAIIGALLDTAPKAWNNNRANENGVVRPEELPGIDPRWTRKNVQRVFTVLEPLIEKCFTDLGNKGSLISCVWKNFVSSIASAGVKEVKVSNDTMTAVAFTFNMLYKIWLKGPVRMAVVEKGDSALFCAAFTALVTTVIITLGVLPFTEKLLTIGPHETFAIVATPSHHPFKTRGDVRSPLYHLFTFLARPPHELACDDNYLHMVKSILHPFFEARKSRQSRIESLYDLSQYIPVSASSPSVSIILWRVLAGFATDYIRGNEEGSSSSSSSSSGSHDQPLGAEYRNAVKILELGISLSPNEVLLDWTDLFTAVSAQVTLEAGESGRAISIIEPLARVLQVISQEPDKNSSLKYCSLLVSNAVYPRDRQSLDMARRRLWGTATSGQKSLSFDPFLHFYTYLRQNLINSYQILTGVYSETHIQLLLNTAELIKRCPVDLIVNSLKDIQEGIVPWLLDEALKYGDRNLPEVAISVTNLWTNICSALRQLPQTDTNLLRTVEPLVCSALESKHQSTASTAITLWNSTFGGEAQLEYPPHVRECLLKLRSITDLRLPSFPDLAEGAISTGPTFQESQEENMFEIPSDFDFCEFSEAQGRASSMNRSILTTSSRTSMIQVVIEVPEKASKKRRQEGASEQARHKTTRKDTTPKLRHDNSQIQFAPVNSSPSTDAVLESQLLTDHQKEVKERQQAETVTLFPWLRTSPIIKRKSSLSKLTFTSIVKGGLDDSTTPTTPPDKASFDDLITSSPTPRRIGPTVEPPSSPPKHASTPQKMSAQSQGGIDETFDLGDVTIPALPGVSCTSTYLGPSAQVVDNFIDTASFSSSIESATGINIRDCHLSTEDQNGMQDTSEDVAPLDHSVRNSVDRFVDALSSPSLLRQAREMTSDEVYVDAMSSPQGGSHVRHNAVSSTDNWPTASSLQGQSQPSPSEPESLRRSSYPISELDETSLLRLVTEFDDPNTLVDATNDTVAKYQSLLPGVEDIYHATDSKYPDAAAALPGNEPDMAETQSSGPSSLDCIVVTPINESSSTRGNHVSQITKPKTARTLRSSSRLKSYTRTSPTIPETPRKKPLADATDEKNFEELGGILGGVPTDSIEKPTSKRIKASSTPEKGGLAILRKRKVDYGGAEVPDSQEAKATELAPSGKKHKSKRKSHSLIAVDGQLEVVELCKVPPVDLGMQIQNQRITTNPTTAGELGRPNISDEVREVESMEDVREHGMSEHSAAIGTEEAMAPTASMSSRFKDILEALRSAALGRDEVEQIESILWDVKGELYAAEKRGRRG